MGPRTVLAAQFVGAAPLPTWPNNPNGSAWFAPDGYHLRSRTPGRFVAVAVPLIAPLADTVVTLRYKKLNGPPGGGVGIILRDQDAAAHTGDEQTGRFYVLEASDRGEAGIWRRDNDIWRDIVPWAPSTAVRPATDGNTLEARASGPALSLTSNGQPAAAGTDATLGQGGVGIFLGGDNNEAIIEELTIQNLN